MKVNSRSIFANASQNVLFINAGILTCATCGNLWLFLGLGLSTLWGLDLIDVDTPINAMQASVRNAVLAPVFFAPLVFLLASTLPAYVCHNRSAALCFNTESLIYELGGMALNMVIDVSTNQTLALLETKLASAQASAVWIAYSEIWQFVMSFASVLQPWWVCSLGPDRCATV